MAAAFQVDLPDEEAYQKESRGAAGTLQGGPSWGTLGVAAASSRRAHTPAQQHALAPPPAVVECYQAWCGPTKAVQSTFKRFITESLDAAANVKFYTVRCTQRHAALACPPSRLQAPRARHGAC